MSDVFDPDAYLASQQAVASPPSTAAQPADVEGFDPDSYIADVSEEKYGTLGQQAKAGLEGIASGIAGPLAPLIETKVLGVKPEDIRARAEENPIAHGAGEAAGLIGSTVAGTGLGGAMAKAGELAVAGTKLAEGASWGHKVGSLAVQQAAEMAVLQGSDRASKVILKDPDASAEGAIANIGLYAALGGAGGALFAGAVNPLWSATAGPALEKTLNVFKNRINGGSNLIMPEARETALKTLGIEADPLVRAAMSEDVAARGMINDLRRGENEQMLNSIQQLKEKASNSVAESLKLSTDDVLHYDANVVGNDVRDAFTRELKEKYDPLAARYAARDAEAATMALSDEARLAQRDRMLEKAIESVGTDSPFYKLYSDFGDRLLAKDTIGGVDKLKTELGGLISKANRGGDFNEVSALKDIKSMLGDFQEQQIVNAAKQAERSGIEGAIKDSASAIAEREALNKEYRNFSKTVNDLTNHLGVGDFKGTGTLLSKLTDKLSAEELLKKFSVKNNAEFIPFLQKHFPETFEKVMNNERQQLIKPSVLAAAKKGEMPIDINKLSDLINKQMAERSSYIESVLPKEALDKIEAAKTILNAVPSPRDSGTPAGLAKLLRFAPTSALAAVGWMVGHPAAGALIGETTTLLGMKAPEAMKLAYLKFMGETRPIEAGAFKAMVEFFDATYKAEHQFAKAAKGVFHSGSQVLATNAIPDQRDRDKLDKQVDKGLEQPESILRAQTQGQLGGYLPQHQMAASAAATRALTYLQSIKPRPFRPGPLDKEIAPSKAEIARYNRALDIAQQPAVVFQHIKNGTLQVSDVQDLSSMYPKLYAQMQQKLTTEMTAKHANKEQIPYKTRISLSMFLTQPLDHSMQPGSIISAQQALAPAQAPQQQGSAQNAGPGRPSALKGKSNAMYMTPGQTAEHDRANRK